MPVFSVLKIASLRTDWSVSSVSLSLDSDWLNNTHVQTCPPHIGHPPLGTARRGAATPLTPLTPSPPLPSPPPLGARGGGWGWGVREGNGTGGRDLPPITKIQTPKHPRTQGPNQPRTSVNFNNNNIHRDSSAQVRHHLFLNFTTSLRECVYVGVRVAISLVNTNKPNLTTTT